MYFTASLIPRDLVIEADSEQDFKEICKRITIEHLVYSWGTLSKEKFVNELKSRHIFLKKQRPVKKSKTLIIKN
jgi:predicted dinucleotide-utilizing enzyme